MGDLWRSQEMQLIQLYVQIEAAHDTVDELGKLGLIQFRDLNPHVNAFQRNFVNEVKRADEMDRKLRFFETQVKQINDEASAQSLPKIAIEEEKEDAIQRISMDDLAAKFDDLEKQIQEMNTHNEALNRNYNQLIELKHVLEKDEVFFKQAGQEELIREEEPGSSLLEEGKAGGVKLRFVSGVILRKNFFIFEKILFRATRGNIYIKFAEIDQSIKDPHSGEMTQKNVFIAFFQGERFESKIKKICESFNANLYPCPDTAAERKGLLEQVVTRLNDLSLLLERGWDQRTAILNTVAQHLRHWQNRVKKEKAIYHTMNKFNYDLGRKCLIAEGWCPASATEQVHIALRTARERSGALVPSILNIIPARDEPPTYFKTNKFTKAFQEIVNAYGVARYREINPAALTIVTFPFQFGIMFGDVGHGFILLLVALFLIYMEKKWEKQLPSDMFDIPFAGRYAMVLMGLFAIYCGALYNEFFCLPMNFGSMWKIQFGVANATNGYDNMTFITERDPSKRWVYLFGVDPVWKGASNELLFYNSLKMKMAVSVGVLQMCLGLFLKCLNAIHFRQTLDIFFEFIPQLLFLLSIFGYLIFMIFYKWSQDYFWQDQLNLGKNITIDNVTTKTMGTGFTPLILNQLIGMFLPQGGLRLFEGQETLQYILLACAGVSVPTLIFAKPLILLAQSKMKSGYQSLPVAHTADSESSDDDKHGHGHSHAGGGHGHGHDGEFDFGEVMVHQALEGIEFVLGSVSHTASYLRLWALSLAHSELATVFWDKIFIQFFEMGMSIGQSGSPLSYFMGGLLGFIAFSGWFGATLCIVVFMESLASFLHALRLHWIEFQSKFYKGDGRLFRPFSYQRILSGDVDE